MNLFLVGGPAEALRSVAGRLPFFPGRSVQTDGIVSWISHFGGGGDALFSGRPIVWDGDVADGRAPLEPEFWLDP